ncbi:hypothetical protein JYG30_19665 [Fibrella sp. USSR17]
MQTTPVPLLEISLLNVWSERDEQQRLAVMNQIYAPDIVFYETTDSPAIQGYQPINELIKRLQDQWPLQFVFALTRPAVVNHGVSHVSWALRAADEIPAATGMDIAIIENGLINALYL